MPQYIGKDVKRREDPRLLAGRGRFLQDIRLDGTVYLKFVHSSYAHARIKSIGVSKAENYPGVIAVLTGEDIAKLMNPIVHPGLPQVKNYVLGKDKVVFSGQPLAAVVAESNSIAEDAVELIDVDCDPLPVVVDSEKTMEAGAPLLHEGAPNNIALHKTYEYGSIAKAFAEADEIVSERLYFPRYCSTPIEPMSIMADYNKYDNRLTFYTPHPGPIGAKFRSFEGVLGMSANSVRIVIPDVGGNFGTLGLVQFPGLVISAISRKLCRPVKWVANRSDELKITTHSADRVAYAEMAAKRNGKILGIKVKLIDNFGAFMLFPEPVNIVRPFGVFTGPYHIDNVYIDAYGVLTNKAPTGANRGYGCQHTFFTLERMMDLTARKLGIDPAEIRSRNIIKKEEHPYVTATGAVYDSGNYPELLRRVLAISGYDNLRKEQERRRRAGEQGHRYLGIGICTTMESSGTNDAQLKLAGIPGAGSGTSEAATVKIGPTGKVLVLTGAPSSGQGHETAAAQIVAEQLGLPIDDVIVEPGFDSSSHPYTGFSGTYSSRFATVGIPALATACSMLIEKAKKIASYMLEARIDDLEYREGRIQVKGAPAQGITLAQVARKANFDTAALPQSVDVNLSATCVFNFPYPGSVVPDEKNRVNLAGGYTSSAHVAVVEVDIETGRLDILRYVGVHDSGTMINPMIVTGQIHGGILHGIGGALYEEFEYDESGQLLSSTFTDYLLPTALESPNFEIDHIETPSPLTILGSKGMGEAGSMSSPAMIANAVEDALSPLGVKITELPLKPEVIWRKIISVKPR